MKKIKPASSPSLLTEAVACLQNDLWRPSCASVANQKTAHQQKKYPFISLKHQNMLTGTWAADVIRMTQPHITFTYFGTILETGTCHWVKNAAQIHRNTKVE